MAAIGGVPIWLGDQDLSCFLRKLPDEIEIKQIIHV